MDLNPRQFLLRCFEVAVQAALPEKIIPDHLPLNRSSNVIIIGAGKAAASMAASFEKTWKGPVTGLVVVPQGHEVTCKSIEVITASHPTPDHKSVIAGERIFELTKNLTQEDIVFVLLSGGGSSLLCCPANDIEFSEKQQINRALLKSGATINEINCVRKHLSAIKGGRLARHCFPAKVYTFTISDVVGDDPSTIASGPTVIDPTTSSDALNILKKYSIDISDTVRHWLESPLSETEKEPIPGNQYTIICSANMALKKVEDYAQKSGIKVINLGELTGDARVLGQKTALEIDTLTISKPTLIISGGETTVSVKGPGQGGRNSEFLLSFLLSLKGSENIYALAADTDGIDGSGNNSGAIIVPDSLTRAKLQGINLNALLDNNDSYTAFAKLDDLIITGPTKTNVNDFRAILVLPAAFSS
ncbi:MAG: glycerate kinase [Alphaproteobacteria bacterium]|nr:glycerate kinase [Alphaproteobacteria bacterium]HPF47390.1 glycerate kinase [Emcibacteraceae bacterium]HRW29947.1 glycerate kinase [Emcibacteraceae bacterium]